MRVINKRKTRKIPRARAPGASRQSVLRVMRELLFGGRYEAEIANEAGVSSRTVMRVARDAKVVGFDVLKDTHGRYYASLQ